MSDRRVLIASGVIVALLAGLSSPAAAQSYLCTKCFRFYEVHGNWVGAGRITCPCCTERCDGVAERAAGLRRTYESLRRDYDRTRQEKVRLESAGQPVPAALADREARLQFDLSQLELQWEILKNRCPDVVRGEVWEGFGGPAGEPPPAGDNRDQERDRRAADASQKGYEDLAHRTAHDLGSILDFLDTASDGFTPPAPTGYQGERAEVVEGYHRAAEGYRRQAQRLSGKEAAKAGEPKVDYKELAEPTFEKVAVVAPAANHQRLTASALEQRRWANAQIAAYQQSLERLALAQAAGDQETVGKQARRALELAWKARVAASAAARAFHKAEEAHQKALDASLAAASKQGVRIADLLERFQAKVKESGLPPDLERMIQAAGGGPDQLESARRRLLALTPAEVEAFLAARRASVKESESPLPPDQSTLDLQFFAAQTLYHDLSDRK